LPRIPRLPSPITNAAQEYKQRSGQGEKGVALLIFPRSISSPRVLSDELHDMLPEACFEVVSRPASAAPMVVGNLARKRLANDIDGRREPDQPDGRRSVLQADALAEQIMGDLRLKQYPPIGPETDRPYTSTKPSPLWPGQNADRPPVPRCSRREATAGFLHGGGQFGNSQHA
jgi:hypothetical protein